MLRFAVALGFAAIACLAQASDLEKVEELRSVILADPTQARDLTADLLRSEASDGPHLSKLYFEDGAIFSLAAAKKGEVLFAPLRSNIEAGATAELLARYLQADYRNHRDHPKYLRVFREMITIAGQALPAAAYLDALQKMLEEGVEEKPRNVIFNAMIRSCSDLAFRTLGELSGALPFSLETLDDLGNCGNDAAVDYLLDVVENCEGIFAGDRQAEDEATLASFCQIARSRALSALVGAPDQDALSQLIIRETKDRRGVERWSTEKLREAHGILLELSPELGLDSQREAQRTLQELERLLQKHLENEEASRDR